MLLVSSKLSMRELGKLRGNLRRSLDASSRICRTERSHIMLQVHTVIFGCLLENSYMLQHLYSPTVWTLGIRTCLYNGALVTIFSNVHRFNTFKGFLC